MGFEISDGDVSLFYSGDLALRSARHNFLSTLADLVARAEAKRCIVLLDATMAGRAAGASSTDVAPQLFDAAACYDDVVVFARDVEQLLYWLDESRAPYRIPNEGLRIWFLTKDELVSFRPPGRTALIPVGRDVADEDDLHPNLAFLPVDSVAWTLHSNDESLREAVGELSELSQVVLFHNFPKRLKKFSKDAGLNCDVLSRSPILLS